MNKEEEEHLKTHCKSFIELLESDTVRGSLSSNCNLLDAYGRDLRRNGIYYKMPTDFYKTLELLQELFSKLNNLRDKLIEDFDVLKEFKEPAEWEDWGEGYDE